MANYNVVGQVPRLHENIVDYMMYGTLVHTKLRSTVAGIRIALSLGGKMH